MHFHSNEFFLFFGAFLFAYYLVRSNRLHRNILLVAASYFFYGWWDPRFLSLILVSTFLDYGVGLKLDTESAPRRRRGWVALSVIGNLGILGFFKYHDFFADSLAGLLVRWGVPFEPQSLGWILPVGISFYTFQTMSYTLDVYRGKMSATRDLPAFMAYVAFFPQLVAGPIERARRLLPQFQETRTITLKMLEVGSWLILWGLFKKVVVADNLAPLVDRVYGVPGVPGIAVVLGTVAFAVQIYCDFSGYSDIARGLAKVMGFELMVNFDLPYFATSPRAFWRRWHISLSTWLRDYLYIPLGGNRHGRVRTQLNVMITMLLGGLWHGAAWHFVLWGWWHGLGLAVQRVFSPAGDPPARTSGPGRILAWAGTMLFVLYGWLLFRAPSMDHAAAMTLALLDPAVPVWTGSYVLRLAFFCLPLLAIQVAQARTGDLLAPLRLPGWARATLQGALILAILLYWEQEASPFIYFQF